MAGACCTPSACLLGRWLGGLRARAISNPPFERPSRQTLRRLRRSWYGLVAVAASVQPHGTVATSSPGASATVPSTRGSGEVIGSDDPAWVCGRISQPPVTPTGHQDPGTTPSPSRLRCVSPERASCKERWSQAVQATLHSVRAGSVPQRSSRGMGGHLRSPTVRRNRRSRALQLSSWGNGGGRFGLWSRRSGLQRRAADGQQLTIVGINTTLGEPWQIVGAAER
jgi:hypothetical protein